MRFHSGLALAPEHPPRLVGAGVSGAHLLLRASLGSVLCPECYYTQPHHTHHDLTTLSPTQVPSRGRAEELTSAIPDPASGLCPVGDGPSVVALLMPLPAGVALCDLAPVPLSLVLAVDVRSNAFLQVILLVCHLIRGEIREGCHFIRKRKHNCQTYMTII